MYFTYAIIFSVLKDWEDMKDAITGQDNSTHGFGHLFCISGEVNRYKTE